MKKIVIGMLLFISANTFAQQADVYVDKQGVMRWGNTKEEVYGFGINYTTPFAHAYKSAKHLGVDLEKAIDADVYHFARLGFDAFRVHVWDTEISDSTGNLINNEHLRLFDYMLMRMKERGMKIFLTPIAFWGNGYPEDDDKTGSFAMKYGKDGCLTNEEAIRAQEKYLFQFLNHVNPYTKLAYKNDPDIVGFEVSNEPHHRGTPQEVTTFIKRMVASIRKTGCKKPVFYNVSHSVHLEDAYFTSGIQGGTFQWYPTGLGAQHELRGNFLPNVDRYVMPFNPEGKFKSMAKIVYEFDAADVGRSYIYPAMARSFREAGVQWATHFAYDPTFMAFANTEYNTHYMNLAYAPQKALSLKIAGEVFHQVPRYKSYGRYPANTTFEGFRVSYEEDLAELVTDKKFFYTNSTSTQVQSAGLEEVAGFGNSSVVLFEGRGAYFLDKITTGVWRLEVMPDAIWVDNIFGRNSLKKEVAVVNWNSWPMTISLPDLGEQFVVKALNANESVSVSGKMIDVKPGVYLLTKADVTSSVKGSDRWKNIRIDEFTAPATTVKKNYVLHQPLQEVIAGKPIVVKATVITITKPENVVLYMDSYRGRRSIAMKNTSGYDFEATIPAEWVNEGYLSYVITLVNDGITTTYPSGNTGSPTDWDYYAKANYTTRVVPATNEVYLFDAFTDANEVSKEWRKGAITLPGAEPNTSRLVIQLEKLFIKDPENLNAQPNHHYALRYNFSKKITGRRNEITTKEKLVLRGRGVEKPTAIEVSLIDKSGNALGGVIQLGTVTNDYEIDVTSLKPTKLVLLPRPYPSFLPYFFNSSTTFDWNTLETVQVAVGEGEKDVEVSFKFEIESIRLK